MSSKLQITPAECRLRAAECHKMGQNARRPHVRDTLAQTIVMLAKQGECDPVRLVLRSWQASRRTSLGPHNPCGVCVICQLR